MSDIELMRNALKRAFSLGQTYWQQVDSEYYHQWKKGYVTESTFKQLVEDTLAAISNKENT